MPRSIAAFEANPVSKINKTGRSGGCDPTALGKEFIDAEQSPSAGEILHYIS